MSIPQILLSWGQLDVQQGPNHYQTYTDQISLDQFTMIANTTLTIFAIRVNWMAFLDDNVLTQYGEITQIINQETVNIPITLFNPVNYIPNAAFFLYGITQPLTLFPNSTAYRFMINSVTGSMIQIQVTASLGHIISWFQFALVYGSPQYIITGQQLLTSLGTIQLFTTDTRTKMSFFSIISIECQRNPRIQAALDHVGSITSSTYSGTIITSFSLSYFQYLPCPVYCTSCYVYTPNAKMNPTPNCDGCLISTQRTGSTCTTCPNQMYSSSDQLNCQQCKSYCNNCSGTSNECNACKSTTLRSDPPNCTTCPSNMYLQLSTDNCQPCSAYCNLCSGSATNCTSCSQNTLRINPPICQTCPDQYHVVSNQLMCQPCLTYCNNCLPNTSQCVACSSSSLRINPPDCQECPKTTYLNSDTCTQCSSFCDTCDQNGCLTCSSSLQYINSLKQCVACPSHCLQCNMTTCNICAGNCLQCDLLSCLKCKADNYYLSGTNCIECPINCSTCDQSSCLTCIGPRQVKNNLCQCNHPCLTCNSIECLTCITLDYRIDRGNCQYCPRNCIACDYVGNCLSGPENCYLGVFGGQQVKCTNCNSNYYLDDNICKQCSSICLECINEPNNCSICRFPQVKEQECQLCESQIGFYSNFQNNTCYTSCGDQIVAGNEQCDDGNLVSHDGCTDCYIDPGYNCSNLGCSNIIYPIPNLNQELSLDSLYNGRKLYLLTYNTPIKIGDLKIKLILIPLINFTQQITYIDNQNIQIQLNLQSDLSNGKLEVLFNNPTQIYSLIGVEQQVKYLQSDISDYLIISNTEQHIGDATNKFINILLILLVILVGLGLLFGGLDIFWNLLDLIQTISYLKYINTIKPYYLDQFLNLFGFLQFQNLPLNTFLNTQNFVQNQIDISEFIPPPKLISDDQFTSSTIINIIPIFNVAFASIVIYLSTQLLVKFIRKLDLVHFVRSFNKLRISIFLYELSQYIIISCDSIQKQWYWSGLIRIFMSSAIDICFMLCLGIYGLQLQNPKIIIRMDVIVAIFCVLANQSITYIISNIAGFQRTTLLYKDQQIGTVYESLRFNIWTKYYNVLLIHKKFLFMVFLVLIYNQPIFQISNIIILQISQLVLFYSLRPIRDNIEGQKQLICEVLMLIAEILLGILVLDDYLDLLVNDSRSIYGWICIFAIVLIIIIQICFDTYQQYKRYYKKKYQLFRKIICCIICND